MGLGGGLEGAHSSQEERKEKEVEELEWAMNRRQEWRYEKGLKAARPKWYLPPSLPPSLLLSLLSLTLTLPLSPAPSFILTVSLPPSVPALPSLFPPFPPAASRTPGGYEPSAVVLSRHLLRRSVNHFSGKERSATRLLTF